MSSRTQRAAMLAQGRRRGRGPGRNPSTRDEIQYAQDSERMAHVIAGMFCGSCGVTVREDNLHAADCIDVPAERRRPR